MKNQPINDQQQLLDHFAAQVLPQVWAQRDSTDSHKLLATECYLMAEAMMTVRTQFLERSATNHTDGITPRGGITYGER